jgi:hypothetical protein
MGIICDRDGADEALTVGARRTVHSITPSFFDKGFLASVTVSNQSGRHGFFNGVSSISMLLLLIFCKSIVKHWGVSTFTCHWVMTLHATIPTALFQTVLTFEYPIRGVFHDGGKVAERAVNEAFNICLNFSDP